jgi:hypothetical protein
MRFNAFPDVFWFLDRDIFRAVTRDGVGAVEHGEQLHARGGHGDGQAVPLNTSQQLPNLFIRRKYNLERGSGPPYRL